MAFEHLLQKKTLNFQDFQEIIHILRSKEGCPWDREQTHMSLRSCMQEEAAELLAGIRIYDQTGNYENLKEELGDILLQVVMHSTIAEEEGIFSFEDVVEEVSKKMIRRHPHVFGEVEVSGSKEVLVNWEEIKKKEKKDMDFLITPLRDIPIEMPSIAKAQKVLKKIDKLYEPGASQEEIIQKLEEEIKGLSTLNSEEEKTQTVKQLLLLVADYARVNHLHGEQILEDGIEELIRRHEQ